jgi:hypothetical protein
VLIFVDANTDLTNWEVTGTTFTEEHQVVVEVVKAFLRADYEHI